MQGDGAARPLGRGREEEVGRPQHDRVPGLRQGSEFLFIPIRAEKSFRTSFKKKLLMHKASTNHLHAKFYLSIVKKFLALNGAKSRRKPLILNF
jgi:hypothetical protein